MSKQRRYGLLCPISRALDAVGDRWALLILRDLHAGPARFQELESGLGIATNLLSTRLNELVDAGLVDKPQVRRGAYELTELGRQSDQILWHLAQFGALLAPEPEPREPGNLRTIALPLRMILEAVPDRPDLTARLVVDNDSFTIVTSADRVEVRYADDLTDVAVTARTGYEAFLDVGEGRMSLDEFASSHLDVTGDEAPVGEFLELVATAMR